MTDQSFTEALGRVAACAGLLRSVFSAVEQYFKLATRSHPCYHQLCLDYISLFMMMGTGLIYAVMVSLIPNFQAGVAPSPIFHSAFSPLFSCASSKVLPV